MPKQSESTISQPPTPEVYTNAAECFITPYDFMMKLGLSDDQGMKPMINVRMSPLHMKMFSRMIVNNIERYEKQFGEITVPDVLRKKK